jgi:RNA polymerase sigma factor (sigma-70 family)
MAYHSNYNALFAVDVGRNGWRARAELQSNAGGNGARAPVSVTWQRYCWKLSPNQSRARGDAGLAGGRERIKREVRNYRPAVESLETLRLLSGAARTEQLSALAAEHDVRGEHVQNDSVLDDASTALNNAAWDAALIDSEVADLLAKPGGPTISAGSAIAGGASRTLDAGHDGADLVSGLSQLNKYLNRAWYRAGIPLQLHDDNSQAVLTNLLQRMGRQRFDSLVSHVGHAGIKEVFNRETSEGIAFFRAVDMVKKRSQRERMHQSIDSVDVAASSQETSFNGTREAALREAIDRKLNPREASLIRETLMGKTPAEIAEQWGVAPKTVSNEKSRIIQKLREALVDHQLN